eukprot:gene10745-19454_t
MVEAVSWYRDDADEPPSDLLTHLYMFLHSAYSLSLNVDPAKRDQQRTLFGLL